ncbi:hypothetical protein ACIBF1_21050 [Spirillospora sp. NPDC050679]
MRLDLDLWEQVRRYAVPHAMIERATERRAAGDWRGACEAAGIRVAVDPAEAGKEHGREVAAALEDDLSRLAPDLVRWHVPWVREENHPVQTPWTSLAVYGPRWYDNDEGEYTPVLCLESPLRKKGTTRFVLTLGRDAPYRDEWTGELRCLWDAGKAAGLLALEGGRERAPFFEADGRLRDRSLLPREGPEPSDPVARAEWITLLQEKGRLAEALAAGGDGLKEVYAAAGYAERRWWEEAPWAAHKLGPALIGSLRRLPPEQRRLQVQFPAPVITLAPDGALRAVRRDVRIPRLAAAQWRMSPDLELLRAGRLTPDDLHPLVSAALFPGRAAPEGPVGPRVVRAPVPATVHCRGERHQLWFENGELRTPHHSAEEMRREDALVVFGGASSGCFAVPRTWGDRQRGPMPPELADQRDELFGRMAHHDTEGVLRMLELGHDPFTRDDKGRFLAELLPLHRHGTQRPALLRRLSPLLDVTPPWYRPVRTPSDRDIDGPHVADPVTPPMPSAEQRPGTGTPGRHAARTGELIAALRAVQTVLDGDAVLAATLAEGPVDWAAVLAAHRREPFGRLQRRVLIACSDCPDDLTAALLTPWDLQVANRLGHREGKVPDWAWWPVLRQLGWTRRFLLYRVLNDRNTPDVLRSATRIDLLIRIVERFGRFGHFGTFDNRGYPEVFWGHLGERLRAELGADPQIWIFAAERLPRHRGPLDELFSRVGRPVPGIGPAWPDVRVLAQAPPEVFAELVVRLGADDLERAVDRCPAYVPRKGLNELMRRAGLPARYQLDTG